MVMERMDTSRLKFQVKRIESIVDRDHEMEMEAMTSITALFTMHRRRLCPIGEVYVISYLQN